MTSDCFTKVDRVYYSARNKARVGRQHTYEAM